MKNFKVLEYVVINNKGQTINDFSASYGRMTRRIARAFKNYMNIAEPNNAPFRIAEVRITK